MFWDFFCWGEEDMAPLARIHKSKRASYTEFLERGIYWSHMYAHGGIVFIVDGGWSGFLRQSFM